MNLNYLLNRYLNIFNNKKVSQSVFFYLIFCIFASKITTHDVCLSNLVQTLIKNDEV